MGLASPRNIGIVAVVALAGGLVPGVPGLVGGAPAEDAAAALPPAPEIVDVVTGERVGPDDGLIRLILTPAGADPVGDADSSDGDRARDAGSAAAVGPSATRPDATRADASAGEPDRGGGALAVDDQADADAPAAAPEAGEHRLRGSGTDADRDIDPEVLSLLTDGAVLHLDSRNRPWAILADGIRVPLFPAGDGERLLAEEGVGNRGATEGGRAATEESGRAARVADTSATGTPDVSSGPEPPAADTMPAAGVGHPLMDEIAGLPGVRRVDALGDGSYAVALEDPDVLDGFDVEVVDDIPMGIGSEPYEPYQWALDNTGDNLDASGAYPVPAQRADADIDGVEARAGATGRGVVVAVIDSGVDFTHPDLAPARWTNDGEDCTNGIDDDANGFVDDCHGWDFAYEDDTPFNRGAHAHGTHVAGIISAAIDGQGIAGVAPDAEIMDLNVGTITASGRPGITTSAVARAIRYAVDNGADIVNLSLGTSPGSPREGSTPVEAAIRYAEADGVLVVAAAGNDGVSLDAGPGWPAGYEMANMITVGASSPSDTRAGFSNWGRVVDIFAPGELILSTVPVAQGRWNFMSGTSQATPIVAAAAALVLDDVPGLPPAEVRARLIAAADRNDALMAHVADGVRLNAGAAVGEGSPEHRLADVAVRIDGLATVGADAPVEAGIDIAVPAAFGAGDEFSWRASVFVSLPDGVAVLTGHEMAVDGVPVESDDLGSVDLGIEGSGSVALTTSLPQGTYALMLEAVPFDDPGQRLGAPRVVTFTVGATAPTDGLPAPSTSDGTGSTPDGGDGGPGGRGSAGPDDRTSGGGPQPGSSPAGGSRTPTPDPGPATVGATDGPVAVGPGGRSAREPSGAGGGAGASSGSRQVTTTTTTATGGRVGPRGGSGSSSPGGGGSGSRTVGGPGADQPPSPPAVTQGAWAIETVNPHFGAVGESTTVQLIGRFPAAAYVWFGDVPGSVLVASDRMMVVLAPAQTTAGTVDISLRRTGDGTVLTMPGGFTYLAGRSRTESGVPGASGAGRGGDGSGSRVGDGGPAGGAGEAGAPGAGDGGSEAAPGAGERDDGSGSGGSSTGSSPAGLDARVSRSRGAGAVVDLGNGLRGVMVDGPNPLVGAPSCVSDPCRI